MDARYRGAELDNVNSHLALGSVLGTHHDQAIDQIVYDPLFVTSESLVKKGIIGDTHTKH